MAPILRLRAAAPPLPALAFTAPSERSLRQHLLQAFGVEVTLSPRVYRPANGKATTQWSARGWVRLPPSTKLDLRIGGPTPPQAQECIAGTPWLTRERLSAGPFIRLACNRTAGGGSCGMQRLLRSRVVDGPAAGTEDGDRGALRPPRPDNRAR